MIEEIIKFVQAHSYVLSHVSTDNVGVKFEVPSFGDIISTTCCIVDAIDCLNYVGDFKIITNKEEGAVYLELLDD